MSTQTIVASANRFEMPFLYIKECFGGRQLKFLVRNGVGKTAYQEKWLFVSRDVGRSSKIEALVSCFFESHLNINNVNTNISKLTTLRGGRWITPLARTVCSCENPGSFKPFMTINMLLLFLKLWPSRGQF